MKFSQDKDHPNIQQRSDGTLKIDQKIFTTSLLLAEAGQIVPWRPVSVEDVQEKDWEPVITLQPAVVIVGTGKTQKFFKAEQLAPLYQRRIGVEVMTTDSAIATLIVLLSERRNAVGALLLHQPGNHDQ